MNDNGLAVQAVNDEPFTGLNNQIVPRNMKISTLNTKQFDPMILEKLEQLEQAKADALDQEDFDTCKHLKMIIDKIKIVGN